MRILCIGLSAAALLTSNAIWAATPEQAGDYAGTIKFKFVSEAGEKTSEKSDLLFSLAEDNSTTLTIGGVPADSGVLFEGNEGFMEFVPVPAPSVAFASLHFKKTSIKGLASGFILGPPFKSLSGKISLKKVAP